MKVIKANWPAPKNINAFTTTRIGGCSQGPFASFNLGHHVEDDDNHVNQNRQLLQQQLPSEPLWLQQVHGNTVVQADLCNSYPKADAAFTSQASKVCCILTADCLPILLCDKQGKHIAAIHGGWRSLATNIIANTLQEMKVPPQDTLAWLGPAIGPSKFEVGEEVRNAFIQSNSSLEKAFMPQQDKWLANLYIIATQQLSQLRVTDVYGGEYCTYSQHELFYSYRRDTHTGRMASLIWLTKE